MRIIKLISILFNAKKANNAVIPRHIIKKYNENRPDKTLKMLCLAPFNSMRLNRSGGVTPCCQNYNLDNLTTGSLKEVWFGPQFNKLREHIKKNDLTFFCDFCEVHLKNENYDSVLAGTYDFHPVNKNTYPSYIDFSLDNTCNLSCIMCNSSLSSQKIDITTVKDNNVFCYSDSFFTELREFIPGLKSVNFSGGEPFLIKDYFKIWEMIFEMNPALTITVTTNGTILNDKVMGYLCKGKFNINVSIDSLQKENYEKIRVNATFEKTLENIAYFKQYCLEKNTTFSFVVCPMRYNWEEIPGIVHYANENNIFLNFNVVTKPFDCALWTMPSNEIATIYEYFKTFSFLQINEIEKSNNNKYRSLTGLLKTWLAHALKLERDKSTADFSALRADLEKTIKTKSINYLKFQTLKGKEIYDENLLIQKIEQVIARFPDLLLGSGLNIRIKKMPDNFIFNEFYYQGVDTTKDNLCSIAYYSI